MLAPGAVLVIAVPNGDSVQAALFGERWLALDLPRHLVHVTAGALIERLGDLGLKVERVSFWRGGQVLFGWLHGIIGALPGHPNLYDAIRQPQARSGRIPKPTRVLILVTAVLVSPLAAIASALEVLAGRGGTVYIEARRG
jgi:hypothetical protein